jgi:hypothetical protein
MALQFLGQPFILAPSTHSQFCLAFLPMYSVPPPVTFPKADEMLEPRAVLFGSRTRRFAGGHDELRLRCVSVVPAKAGTAPHTHPASDSTSPQAQILSALSFFHLRPTLNMAT